ncbi:MAG: DUF5916 domain-containing protein [Saprospiraceae bacterium]|nr:DUF5916 domain-containing protein [Saprospiraceae bacterium]
MKPNHLHLLFFSLISIQFLSAQDITDVQKFPGELNFDGHLHEAAWNQLTTFDMVMQIPDFGKKPTQRADIYFTYDENYLYLAGRMFLEDSSYYRPTTFKRDAFDGTTDYFGLVLDTYNDKENGVAFFTGPSGFRWDGVVWNDAQAAPGEFPVSTDWNTFFDVKVNRTDFGWSCEMRVPWTSLRFQDDNGTVVMGMTCWWYSAGKNEVQMYPGIPMHWGDWSAWKPSQMKEYRFKNVFAKKPLYLTPYVLGGLQQVNDLNDAETEYLRDDDPTFEAGLDIKYSLTSNLTMDVTVNTDFAQVEADDQQVNLTRFSLFFPEKRQFFQERASIFDFNFEQFNRVFYSRKIGLDDDGNPVRILGGARMVGRIGKFDVGFLDMQTAQSEELNAENFGLLRLRRQLGKDNSYLGGILTNRTDFNGIHNTLYGIDGIFKITGDDYLNVKWVQSFENDVDNEVASLDPSRVFLRWEKRRSTGFFYSLTYSRVGENYNPGMGFELRENYNSINPRVGFGKLGKEHSNIISWQVFTDASRLQNNTTDTIETANVTTTFQTATKGGWNFIGSAIFNHEYLSEVFELSSVDQSEGLIGIPSGEYDFWQLQTTINSPFQNYFVLFGGFTLGGFFDGDLVSFNLMPRYKVSNHLEFDIFYQFSRAEFENRNQTFHSHLARVKGIYMFDTKLSIAAFLQFNSLDEAFTSNVRLRYNPKEGNDLYIVYNDLMNSNRARELPHLPFSSERALVLKYTYTFKI